MMASDNPHIRIDTWRRQLDGGLAEQGNALDEDQCTGLIDYLALLFKWNSAYNLTAVRDPQQMVSRQLLDSLSILNLVKGPRVLDVGTGAGLPGVPLAIARPDWHFTLLDANGKKMRFVRQAVMELNLSNVHVEQQRIEAFKPAQPFDTVTSRAFAELKEFVCLTETLVAANGQWVAMKAALAGDESAALPAGLNVGLSPLNVPGEKAQRYAVTVTKP